MDPVPKIAVIIVNWNSGALLERCLAALAQQTLPPQQILVVDNASQEEELVGIEKRYPRVRLIRLTKNLGFAVANNRGVRAAKGQDWVALLNPDAFPEPQWLAALWHATQDHPDYTFFGSCLLRANVPHELDGVGDAYHVSGLAWRQHHGHPVPATPLVAKEIFAPCAAAALYPRDVFLAAGGFDERYFCYYEDVDLAFRLRLLGYRCLFVPDAVVYHVGSGSTQPDSDASVYYGHRNLMWTYVKNMPASLLVLFLPQHIMLNIVTLIWFSLRGKAWLMWRAKRDGLKGLLQVWKQRQRVQATRQVKAQDVRRLMAKGVWVPYRRQRDPKGNLYHEAISPGSL